MPVRVVLAEDHQIIREGLRAVLTAAPEIELLGTYADYDELLAAVDEHVPDVVLDRHPDATGPERRRDPDRRTAAGGLVRRWVWWCSVSTTTPTS